jgi:RHS repeat-associated protein
VDNLKVSYVIPYTRTECPETDLAYRFGFNGKEKESDIYGESNVYDFGARIHDARIGRFLSVDPLWGKNLGKSPYNFAHNSPLRNIDLYGEDAFNVIVEVTNARKREATFTVINDKSLEFGRVAVTYPNGNGGYSRDYISFGKLRNKGSVTSNSISRIIDNKTNLSDFAVNADKDLNKRIEINNDNVGINKKEITKTSTIDVHGKKFTFEVAVEVTDNVKSIEKIAEITTYHPESNMVAETKAKFESMGYKVNVVKNGDASKKASNETMTVTLSYKTNRERTEGTLGAENVKSITNEETDEKIEKPTKK